MNKKSMTERGHDATVAYLGRSGMQIVAENYKTPDGIIPIIATDGDTLVRVGIKVTTMDGKVGDYSMPSAATRIKHHVQMADYISKVAPEGVDIAVRFDDVQLKVIAEDRALLRHHRAAYC